MADVKITELPLHGTLTNDDLLIIEQSNGTKKLPLGDVIPDGGTTGQLLSKHSNTDYDISWEDAPEALPQGGTTGQVLSKASNTDYDVSWENAPSSIFWGNDVSSSPVPLNADQLQGYTVNLLMKTLYPIGAVYMTTDEYTNPADIITGTTWTLISSVALASEHIFGNGKTLGLANGGSGNFGLCENTSNNLVVSNGYGSAIGSSTSQKTAADNLGYGIVTKALAGAHPEYSGIIADTITVYMWERTA